MATIGQRIIEKAFEVLEANPEVSENPDDPRFTIRCRPRHQQPDLFYANRYMKLIEQEMF